MESVNIHHVFPALSTYFLSPILTTVSIKHTFYQIYIFPSLEDSLRRFYVKVQDDKNEQKEISQAVLWQTKSLLRFI